MQIALIDHLQHKFHQGPVVLGFMSVILMVVTILIDNVLFGHSLQRPRQFLVAMSSSLSVYFGDRCGQQR